MKYQSEIDHFAASCGNNIWSILRKIEYYPSIKKIMIDIKASVDNSLRPVGSIRGLNDGQFESYLVHSTDWYDTILNILATRLSFHYSLTYDSEQLSVGIIRCNPEIKLYFEHPKFNNLLALMIISLIKQYLEENEKLYLQSFIMKEDKTNDASNDTMARRPEENSSDTGNPRQEHTEQPTSTG